MKSVKVMEGPEQTLRAETVTAIRDKSQKTEQCFW